MYFFRTVETLLLKQLISLSHVRSAVDPSRAGFSSHDVDGEDSLIFFRENGHSVSAEETDGAGVACAPPGGAR